ncbi:MAG: hypothetical protein HY298_19400 [Verrucomicrobia bacterium]|nr:hypothetical protein [Verrucomicrobiota bacterium]
MKLNSFTSLVVVGTTLCFLGGPAFAGKTPQLDSFRKELKSVPVPEMGAKAARLVAEAKADVRESTALAVVSAAIELKPVAAIAVVSAISRENPDVAPATAARAAGLLPKDAAAIAKAAAGAAPAQAAKIVLAVCKAVPAKYAAVATAVSQAVPYASKEIVEAVTTALPSLKPFVERADTNLAGRSKSVGSIMAQTESLVAYTAQLTGTTSEKIITSPTSNPILLSGAPSPQGPVLAALPPPTVGPPFTPLGGTPTELNRTNTGQIPPGGVRYSSP